MIVIPVQTVLLIYARRSRVNLRYPWIKFWVLGLMYYNLSDWLGIAWVAEEYPGIRALDVCAGDYLGAGTFIDPVRPNPDLHKNSSEPATAYLRLSALILMPIAPLICWLC